MSHEIIEDRADWLIDAVACSTQNRMFLRGEPEYDDVAGQAIMLNGKAAMKHVERHYRIRISDLEIRLAQRDAALRAADDLDKIAEMLLRMMDDVIAPTGLGDMAIVPDGSVSVISAWKTLAAYRKARGQDATAKG